MSPIIIFEAVYDISTVILYTIQQLIDFNTQLYYPAFVIDEPIELPMKEESPPTKQEDQLETLKPTETIETAKTLATPKSDDSETQKVSKAEQDKRTEAKEH
uniref:Uncharacterized protein n=1 Tax=Acrobeloides nanus TaxID=290746 RepID=A0A914C1M1_9BILA